MPRTLTDFQVLDILADFDRGMSAIRLAEKFHTSRETVYGIIRGKTHRRVVDQFEAACGPTEAELDAMIAERLPTMPREPRYERQADYVPLAVIRGRGIQATQRRALA